MMKIENSQRQWLEDQLRRLPEPAVPHHLEEKLLAEIPALSFPGTARRPRWPYWLAPLAAAAVVTIALLVSQHRGGRGGIAPVGRANQEGPRQEETRKCNLPQPQFSETNPCDILPPLRS